MELIRQFRYLFGAIDKETRKQLIIYGLLSLISPLIGLISVSAILPILTAMLNNTASNKELIYAFGMVFLMLLCAIFEIISSYVSSKLTYDGAHKLSMKMYELCMKENLLEHNQKDAMQTLSVVRSDTMHCVQFLMSGVSALVTSLMLFVFFIFFIYYDGLIGLAICAMITLEMLGMYKSKVKKVMAFGEQIRELDIRINGQVTTSYGAFKELKLEENPGLFKTEYENGSITAAKVKCEYNMTRAMVGVIMRNGVYMLMFLSLGLLMLFNIQLADAVPQAMVTVVLFLRVLPMGSTVVNALTSAKAEHRSFEIIENCLTRYEEVKAREAKQASLRRKQISFEKGLDIEHLYFSYPNGTVIFEDAELHIPSGASVAVIGPSGAGKTTLLDILLGLIPPQKGKIFYDDYDIVSGTDSEGACLGNLGRIVSYFPQTVYLNGNTIRRNVAFFVDEKDADDDKVEECLKNAIIWEDVKKMPDGIDTLVGPPGVTVSGGQRQRIALARALYKDFELLVMDEATAALDMETEAAVIDSIRKVKEAKTVLMVTHHMSLANECDILYKIENKKLVRIR